MWSSLFPDPILTIVSYNPIFPKVDVSKSPMDVVFIDWDEYGIYGCHVDVFGFPLVEFLPCFFGVVM